MQKNIFIFLLLLTSIVNARETLTAIKKIPLTLDSSLQKQVHSIAQSMKKSLQAKDVDIVVMNSKTGEILSLVDSNKDIVKSFPENYIANFSYEPGFVIAPIVFSLALDKKLITPHELINTHRGNYKIKGFSITDRHWFDYLGADDVIVYTSNIGMSQIAQKLSGEDYHNGLIKFGFTKHTVEGFSNEDSGFILDVDRLNIEIYKAVTSYGYITKVNLIQLLQAYNVFNNNGILIKPKIIAKSQIEQPKRVIDAKTAKMMKKILIKTVIKGTGRNAQTKGLEIGGKTGTAHIAKNGRYINEYNCSFVGFANGNKKSYTIAVLVQKPQTSWYASQSAAVVFKKVVDVLMQERMLKNF